MKSLLGFLLMALVSVCFFPALTNAQDKEGVFKADGQLSKDDSKDRVRRFSVHKVHMVKMTAGQSYTIDLVSRDFDAYLRLEDSTGQELAKDDDSGGGLNARIVFRAPKDDTYRIIATTFISGTGNYTLTVQGAGLGVQPPAAKTPIADEAIREAIKLLQAGKAKAENKADQDKIANAVTALEALAVQNKEQPILGKKEVKKEVVLAKIGDEFSFNNDSTWVVVNAEDRGNSLKSNNQFQKDAQTNGKFIMVQFKVTNLTNKEERLLNGPKLIDSQGREFRNYDKQFFYIPKGAKTMSLEAIPAGIPREFYGVYEVPADANGFRFQARDLKSVFSPDYKLVDLGF